MPTYTHPLTGDIHAVGATASAPPRLPPQNWVLLIAALLLGLAVAVLIAAAYRGPTEPRVVPGVEYEPLSQVNDGSYEESSGGGSGRALGVLRRLRSR